MSINKLFPEYWFILEDENLNIDGRKNVIVHPYTSNNNALAIIDGEKYFGILHEEISDLIDSRSDNKYFHLSGWRVTLETRMFGANSDVPTFQDILTECIDNKDIKLRFLMWMFPFSEIEEKRTINFIPTHANENIETARFLLDRGQEVILDSRLPSGTFASHHQKFIVLGDENKSIAFVGGIDITKDRWDNSEHNYSDDIRKDKEFFEGWHDVQVKVEGKAVEQIWQTFTNRWNDSRPANNTLDIGQKEDKIDEKLISNHFQDIGTHHIQVLHTFPCQSPNGGEQNYPFAKEGDYSYEQALIKAIKKAEHYIYIEDQYFWSSTIVDALAELVKVKSVTIIVLVAHIYDVPGLKIYSNYLRQSALDKIKNGQNIKGKVYMYHLQKKNQGKDIYVHAKTMIIDDRYVVIGTANICNRSMRNDTEIGIAIIDEKTSQSKIGKRDIEVCDFAKKYRIDLWNEHLNPKYPIENPLNDNLEPNGWPLDNNQIHHVYKHEIPKLQNCVPSFIPNIFMNPDTLCLKFNENNSLDNFRLPLPLSYFKNTEPFSRWFKSGSLVKNEWLDSTYLNEFSTNMEYENSIGSSEIYKYDMELLADKEVRMILPNPKGLMMILGGKGFDKDNKAKLKIEIKQVFNKDGVFQNFYLNLSGDIKFRLPSFLVKKVVKKDNKWKIIDDEPIDISLELESIQYEDGKLKFSKPLTFKDNTEVMIFNTQVIGKLNKLDIEYINEVPKLSFIDIDILQ